MVDEATKDDEGGAVDEAVASGNVILGQQSFEYANIEIRVEDAAHQRRVDQQRLDHDLSEEAKNNDLRRKCFWLLVIVLVVVLGVSSVVGISNDQEKDPPLGAECGDDHDRRACGSDSWLLHSQRREIGRSASV